MKARYIQFNLLNYTFLSISSYKANLMWKKLTVIVHEW